MEVSRIEYLLKRYLNRTISEPEIFELNEVLADDRIKDKTLEVFDRLIVTEVPLSEYRSEDWESVYQRIISSGNEIGLEKSEIDNNVHQINWKRWLAAAILIGLVVLGGIWLYNKQGSVDGTDQLIVQSNDVHAPDKTRATIKLADGTMVPIDNINNGELASQGGVSVIKGDDGLISYEVAEVSGVEIELKFNTLSNPRGSKIVTIKLSDGTKVWLNSGSSITYPVTFLSKNRQVTITGEAYFEVYHDASKPFHVKVNEMDVEVIGTEFNINSYGDNGDLLTTLINGSVKISFAGKAKVLKPGESARAIDKDLSIATNVNVEEAMAWKNGKFVFNSNSIQSIMKQVERWYDVEVEYSDKVNNHFTGIISRDVNASEVLNMLRQTGVVDFEIIGKKVIVKRR